MDIILKFSYSLEFFTKIWSYRNSKVKNPDFFMATLNMNFKSFLSIDFFCKSNRLVVHKICKQNRKYNLGLPTLHFPRGIQKQLLCKPLILQWSPYSLNFHICIKKFWPAPIPHSYFFRFPHLLSNLTPSLPSFSSGNASQLIGHVFHLRLLLSMSYTQTAGKTTQLLASNDEVQFVAYFSLYLYSAQTYFVFRNWSFLSHYEVQII